MHPIYLSRPLFTILNWHHLGFFCLFYCFKGLRVSLTRHKLPLCILAGISEDAECIRTDLIWFLNLPSLITSSFCLRSVKTELCELIYTTIPTPTHKGSPMWGLCLILNYVTPGLVSILTSQPWYLFFLTDSHHFYKNMLSFNNLILSAQSCQSFYH